MKLDHVAIESTDIDASVQWYKKMWDDAKVAFCAFWDAHVG